MFSISFALRVFFSFALSLSLTTSVLAQSQPPPALPGSNQSPAEAAVREVVEKYFALYAAKDLSKPISMWSEKSPDYASVKENLQRQFTTEDYGSERADDFASQSGKRTGKRKGDSAGNDSRHD